MWCWNSDLRLMVSDPKEAVTVLQRGPSQQPPLGINGAAMERLSSSQCLGVNTLSPASKDS